MKQTSGKPVVAKAIASMATTMMTSAANSRCMFVYHQPKQPKDLKQFRKF